MGVDPIESLVAVVRGETSLSPRGASPQLPWPKWMWMISWADEIQGNFFLFISKNQPDGHFGGNIGD